MHARDPAGNLDGNTGTPGSVYQRKDGGR